MQARTEAAINHVKNEQAKIKSQQLAYEAGLLDPDMTFRSLGFTNFLSTWLIRQVDPKKTHPNPLVQYVSSLTIIIQRIHLMILYNFKAATSQGSANVLQGASGVYHRGYR